MHPIQFVKAHPVGTAVSMIAGMMIGPWIIGKTQQLTGVGVRIPQYGGQG